MKKYFYSFAILAATLLSACQQEFVAPQEEVTTSHKVSFRASVPSTKTTMEINGEYVDFAWEDDDDTRMAIWEDGVPGSNISGIVEDGILLLEGTFSGSAEGPHTYTAMLNGHVDAEQVSTDTYDNNSDVLVSLPVSGKGSDSFEFQFGRVVSIVKMTLKGLTEGETVNEVVITSDKPIAGTYNMSEKTWESSSKTITLTCDEVVPASGQVDVYFVSLPVEDAQLSVSVSTDGGSYSKEFARTITFTMGDVRAFGVALEKNQASTSATLTSAEISAAMSGHTGSASYGEMTIPSSCGDWTGVMYRASTASFVQIRAKDQARLTSPSLSQSVSSVKISTTNSTIAGRSFYIMPGDYNPGAGDYVDETLSAACIGSHSTISIGEEFTISLSEATTRFTIVVFGGAGYISSVEAFYGDVETVNVESVSLDKTSATLEVGETETLVATVLPANATNKNVTWSTDAPTVATVDNGTVTAVGAGNATITVTTVDGSKTATCAVTVNAPQGGSAEWVSTTFANLKAGDQVVIVRTSGDAKAMSNDNGTSLAPTAVDVTISSNKLATAPDANLIWYVGVNGANRIFNTDKEGTKWLYCTATNNGVRVGTNDNKTFTLDEGYLQHIGTSRYVGVYNDADWRCYTSKGGNIANQTFSFFVKTGGSDPAPTQPVDASWSVDPASVSVEAGQNTTATITTNYDGTLSVASADERIATASIDGKVITVTGVAAGPTTLTVTGAATSNYNAISKTIDVTVTAAPELTALTTVDAIFEAATTAGSTATSARVTFNNWVVSGVKGSSAYVTDNAGKGFVVYGSGHGFAEGDILSGTVNCKVQLFNGYAELTTLTSSTTGLTVTKGGVATPQEIAIANLGGVNTGAVITFAELTYNGTAFSDGVNTITPYNTLMALPTLVNGKKYSVTGVYIQYNSTKEIAPRTNEDIVVLGGGGEGTSVEFDASDFSGKGTSGSGSAVSVTKEVITVSTDKGYGTTQFRVYSGGKLTISSSAGNIQSIAFTFSGSYTGGLSTSYSDVNSTSWSADLTSQARITKITVVYAE